MASRRYFYTTIMTTGVFASVDLVWLGRSTVSLSPLNWSDFATVAACVAGAVVVSRFVEWRLATDASRMARIIRRASDFLQSLALVTAAFVPLAISTTIFMYLASATERPFADPTLASIDMWLGFDWQRFLAATNNGIVAPVLSFAYHALGPQLPLVLLWHAVTRRNDRAMELVALLAVSSLFTGASMAIVPAEGAYAYFRPAAEQFNHFTAKAGVWHYDTLMALRSGQPFDLVVIKSDGLVTFPSYHTALGIMIVYALRRYRWLFWPVGCLNAIMIVSTLPEGGHHLIDVIAGTMVGIASILVVRKIGSYHLQTARTPSTAYPAAEA
ncbi:phosphatase PAP2 family protein [Mesorhizobium sp. WSM4935]|uniref:phosphatase PAP2 family protein n=1 Tax=Mesorhizobium sp. WSM4935 TaxID=3038547 RepID=UPI002414DDC1|nr:phosphatase PAP2 family protein [Mesorhizobium sp. WSM4935]MDG4874250.1 phosphatase PAP2 family protein [Mesorhizobium sp. WSM4935]